MSTKKNIEEQKTNTGKKKKTTNDEISSSTKRDTKITDYFLSENKRSSISNTRTSEIDLDSQIKKKKTLSNKNSISFIKNFI